MRSKGLLIVVSGPSGAGKGTICKELLSHNKDIAISVSATTRSPRSGEVDGKNYFFLTKEKFEQMLEEDQFIEFAQVYGNYYGTPKKYVVDNIETGTDILLEIDIQGALQIKEKFPQGVFIFILPPSMEELKKRITNRGTETEEDIVKRFTSAYEELNYVSKYNYAVVNDVVESACKKIESIIMAEKCRVDRHKEEDLLLKDI